MLRKFIVPPIFLSALALWTSAAHAALGEQLLPAVPATQAVTIAPSAQKKIAVSPVGNTGWRRQQTTMQTGTLVQEFATDGGIVFAVSWQGPVLPDLNALLGKYFSTFEQAALAARMARRVGGSIQINESGLIMQSGGRMRSFSGFAYAPALVPQGVSVNELLP